MGNLFQSFRSVSTSLLGALAHWVPRSNDMNTVSSFFYVLSYNIQAVIFYLLGSRGNVRDISQEMTNIR